MIDNIDLKLRLLSGKSIYTNNIEIKPFTLSEISNIGYLSYFRLLNFFCIEPKDILDEQFSNIEDYSIYYIFTNIDQPKFTEQFFLAVQFFLRQNIIDYKNGLIILEDNNVIDSDAFENIRKIIQLQNCVEPPKAKAEFNPHDENAQQIIDKINKSRDKINKIKSMDSSDLDLFDLISAFSAKSNNVNILDVWNLTLYQFNDQFKRIKLNDEISLNIRSLLAGADPKDIDLKHWISKLD